MKNKGIIWIVAAIAALLGVFFALPHLTQQSDQQTQKLPPPNPVIPVDVLAQSWPTLIQNAASPKPFGNPSAPYTVLEIGDFQCPNCGKAEPMVMSAIESSHGKAKLYFYNFPIPQIHPHALIAAQAGLAAAAQGKFWPMYAMLYGHQDELIDSQIEFNARSINGLDVNRFTSDLENGKYIPIVENEVDTIESVKQIQSVPTALVRDPNGKIYVYQGAAPTLPHLTYPGINKMLAHPPWAGPAAVAESGVAPTQPGT